MRICSSSTAGWRASSWAVAVRKPDGKIAQVVNEIASPMAKRRIWRLPVIRGVIALGCGSDSLRFRPALTVTRAEIDGAVAAVREALLDEV